MVALGCDLLGGCVADAVAVLSRIDGHDVFYTLRQIISPVLPWVEMIAAASIAANSTEDIALVILRPPCDVSTILNSSLVSTGMHPAFTIGPIAFLVSLSQTSFSA